MNTFILLQKTLPKRLLTRLMGLLAQQKVPKLTHKVIEKFAEHYQVNFSEAENSDPKSYATFNQFFTRALKAGARPIDSTSNSIVSPADGCVSELGKIAEGQLLQAKGIHYSAEALLGDKPLAQAFTDGAFMTVYLSPKDYHRVHIPFDGTLIKTIYIPGKLFSVNQTTAENLPGLFSGNERLVMIFQTTFGPMAIVMVGALIVGYIETVWSGEQRPEKKCQPTTTHFSERQPPLQFKKGDEIGRFKLGSTAIVLLPKNSGQWLPTIQAGSTLKMGEKIGEV